MPGRSRATRFVPLPSGVRVVVVNSGVHHALASGEYNRRRAECESAVAILQREMREVRALRDVSEAELARYRAALGEHLHRRVRHVVTENARALAFADALERGAVGELGDLMSRSHASLRDDYGVSTPELDLPAWLRTWLQPLKLPGNVQLQVDVDPVSFL